MVCISIYAMSLGHCTPFVNFYSLDYYVGVVEFKCILMKKTKAVVVSKIVDFSVNIDQFFLQNSLGSRRQDDK